MIWLPLRKSKVEPREFQEKEKKDEDENEDEDEEDASE